MTFFPFFLVDVKPSLYNVDIYEFSISRTKKRSYDATMMFRTDENVYDVDVNIDVKFNVIETRDKNLSIILRDVTF